jgi:predicted porin
LATYLKTLEINLMKKSLLAVAIAAALPSIALAQSNVTLYGIVDAGIAWNGNTAGSALRIDSGIVSTSRWGLRGSEDLGGGLKGIFNLEAGFNPDAPGALDFSRRAVVGLNGGFGEVRLGRDYTPAFLMAGSYDILGYGHFGNTLNYTVGSSPLGLGGTSVRFSNGLFYDSPDFGGFQVKAALRFGEVIAASDNGRGLSLSGGYNAGPLNVGAYLENSNQSLAGGDFATNGTRTVKKIGLGGGYNFGAFALKGGFQRVDFDSALKITFFNLGASVNAGPGAFLAQFSRAKADITGSNPITTIGLAYDYPLSKRTLGYVSYGQANNGGVLWSSNTQVTAPATGANAGTGTQKGFAVGVRHSF